MIIFLIALALLIVKLIFVVRDCHKGTFKLSTISSFINFINLIIIVFVNITSFTMVIESLVNSVPLEKRLENQYKTLTKSINNPYAISDIIKYNEEVTEGKCYLNNPWISWYIEPAYRDAKIIEIEE